MDWFRKMDTSGDGKVSRAEPRPQALSPVALGNRKALGLRTLHLSSNARGLLQKSWYLLPLLKLPSELNGNSVERSFDSHVRFWCVCVCAHD